MKYMQVTIPMMILMIRSTIDHLSGRKIAGELFFTKLF
jgi:hypothetical protein